MELISTENYVESPFVIMQIGDYTFGSYTESGLMNNYGGKKTVTYPNCMKSINVVKINGEVNTYTIKLNYAITESDDPNMLEKVLSSVRDNRKMTLTYGDWNSPSNVYREESALITGVTSNLSMRSSNIEYTISGVSDALSLNAALYDFPARVAKPSDVIKEILYNKSYGVLDVFTGMVNKSSVAIKNLLASDDKKVEIASKQAVGAFDYINYLVGYMSSTTNTGETDINDSMYQLCIVDDAMNELGGPYFQVRKIGTESNESEGGAAWEIDVGYPGKNLVTNFEIDNDESWSLLYDYQSEINQSKYVYRLDNDGKIVTEYSPSIIRSKSYKVTTERDKNWWTLMTQYPITARITIKGLIRPTILMDYIKINVLFYGKKHISSGLYVITKQEDSISRSGYRTTLTLLRVRGDE